LPGYLIIAGVLNRRGAILIGSLLVIATLNAQQPAPFTAKTNLVVVPAVVVDKKGATVEGLTQSDFVILEDGKPVPIETFLAPSATGVTGEQGRFIVLALDNLNTPAELAFRVRTIAKMFVDKMGPSDVMSVISISGGKAVTTSMKTELNAAISRFAVSGAAETMTFRQKTQHGLEMITALSEQVEKVNHRRKVLVVIGDTNMFNASDPVSGDSSLAADWTHAIATTTRTNVSVYTIDPKGAPLDASAERGGPGQQRLDVGGDISPDAFTLETGGYASYRTNNFGGAVNRVWQESASYYLLGYAPPLSDGKVHNIEVKVTRPGVTVRARKARG
jgi:VWFA-related protein